jgi:hypothetical protein
MGTPAREARHRFPPKNLQIQPPHVARFSSLTDTPPHTTNPGSVRSHSLAPCLEALHTRISRHVPASPLCAATRAHSSGSAATKGPAQWMTRFKLGDRFRSRVVHLAVNELHADGRIYAPRNAAGGFRRELYKVSYGDDGHEKDDAEVEEWDTDSENDGAV